MKYYVRQLGKKYGKGDGTSYKNAFTGFEAIHNITLKPGDTIVTCGTIKERIKSMRSNSVFFDYTDDFLS